MKRRQLDHGWTKSDEMDISRKLESELAKVYRFTETQLKAIKQRADQGQVALNQLVNCSSSNKKKFDALADMFTEILFDINDLAKFLRLNATGFEKITKKHDRYTKLDLQSVYRQSMSQQWPLDKLSLQFDVLIVKISELHDVCYLHGNPRSQEQAYSQGGDQTAFERATAKYWIHPENITEVKSIILFHLPVHVFNQKKQYEEEDMAVSSVYFDNKDFDLYSERLNREDGAEAIRLRWYGPLNQDSNNVYVERKTHKAAWLQGKSVKDRFRLKEPQVDLFLAGKYTADQFAEDLRSSKKSSAESVATVEESRFIASGVQRSVKNRRLTPMCRVFYNRTAFQLPGDQRLRISLDSNLTFIREDGCRKKPQHWRRTDVGIDYPFRYVPDKDISRFPYAILETKLQTHLGQESPAWLTALIESHLVHEVPRFSKYLHGASMLFQKQVPIHPYWLAQFDQDIRKEPVANVGLSRSMSFKPLVNGHHRQSLLMMYEKELKGSRKGKDSFTKSKSLGDLRVISQNIKLRQEKPHLSINLLDTGVDHQHPNNNGKDILSRIWNYGTTPTSAQFSSAIKKDGKKEVPVLPRSRSSPEKFSKGQMKKTEPKTFFANERTFISWLQFCALLLTVALNLLNNGDHISRIIGAVFIIIASLLSLYALARFQIRSWQLRTNKQIVRYDDVWGPTVLCILIVTALIINFYLRADTLSSSYHQEDAAVAATADSVDGDF
ncbi:VTC domain-containing protein [Parasitella parasitica]|nr:VTC domain-containing protein [Parasitella parasitica]